MPSLCGSVAPLRRIREIDFGILSPDEIIKNSVTTGDTNEDSGVYQIEISRNGRPLRGGLNDPRLGTVSRTDVCETCRRKYEDCPVTLDISCSTQISSTLAFWSPCFPFPVFVTPSYRVLSCVCYKCSRCLVAQRRYPRGRV